MLSVLNQVTNTAVGSKIMIINQTISFDISKLYKILVHNGEAHLNATVNAYRIKVFGNLEACESCDLNKEKQKNINRL
jgi:hypothetical protein